MVTRKKPATMPVLPDPMQEALADALAPAALSPQRAAALKARVLDRVRGERPPFVTVRAGDGRWVTVGPGVAVKLLDDEGAMHSLLVRLQPGAGLPPHRHAADELCVVLEGTARLGDVEVAAGDYHFAGAGTRHGDVVSATGALLYLRVAAGAIPLQPYR